MREKTKKLNALAAEFKALKQDLFGTSSFVIPDEGDEGQKNWERYNQLLGLFHPNYRRKGWVNPLVDSLNAKGDRK